MATRKKKKAEDELFDLIGYTEGSVKEIKVVKGSHLTVTTHPDGRTELKWDDEALLRDVRGAILKAESVIPVTESKPKRSKAVR